MKIRASDKYIQRTPVFVQRKSCLVVVELDVEQFPLPYFDAGVASLMRLVAEETLMLKRWDAIITEDHMGYAGDEIETDLDPDNADEPSRARTF